jgi:hypothetical protein
MHDINKMFYVGEMPWHGLGVWLPARASHEEIVAAAGFYDAVEKDVIVPPARTPVPEKAARGKMNDALAGNRLPAQMKRGVNNVNSVGKYLGADVMGVSRAQFIFAGMRSLAGKM